MSTPTVHEFLYRLVVDAQTRSAFTADPRGLLDAAGFDGLGDADVAQAASLSLDHVPIDVVDEYVAALQPGLDRLVGGQHVALTYPMPFVLNGADDTELSDMPTPELFSALGDVDSVLPSAGTEASSSEDTTGSNNPVGSGNDIQAEGLVGDISTGDVTGVAGDLNLGNVAGNGVTDVVGGVEDVVADTGVTGQVGDIVGGGDITGGLEGVGDVVPEVGDVTGALPTEVVGELAPQGDLTAPVTGAEGPVGAVGSTVGDLAGGLGL
ncbi:hypothetical protein [Saccharopolyspora cebuensis]|uniref:Uncharacterized protein n=1 Tax=Saccharopolyspora cebuensis TaxID=418759 RepID=A0ABV4CR04_9PSEU